MKLWKRVEGILPKQSKLISRTLESLHPGESVEGLLEAYYREKMQLIALILTMGMVLAFGMEVVGSMDKAVDENGVIQRLNKDQTVMLQAQIVLEEENLLGEFELEVGERILIQEEAEESQQQLQPELSEEEKLLESLEELLEQENELQKYDEQMKLPEEIEGKEIKWKEKRTHEGILVLGIALLTAGLVFFAKDRDLQSQLEQRKKEMKREYTVMVNKYALLLEAGLTIRGAFFKICQDSRRENSLKSNPLYEEMHYTCNELKAGISESRAYENLARRIGMPEYAKLCGLLVQNLKKGNTALIRRMKEEGREAAEKNLQWRKAQGEEAGTKLLLPMSMMLLMVLVMLLLPAFSGIGLG